MIWAAPAMLSVAGAFALLSLVNFHLWWFERRTAFAYLGVSWLLYAAFLLVTVYRMIGGTGVFWSVAFYVGALGASLTLIAGIFDLVDRSLPSFVVIAGAAVIGYVSVLTGLGVSGPVRVLPPQLLMAGLSMAAAYQMLRFGSPRKAGWLIVGPLLAFRGILIVAQAFVPGYVPAGVWINIVEVVADFVLLCGIFIFYFEGVGIRVRETERELREALAGARTLKGLLPVCAHCKKIRDDEGYWRKLEAYVRANAGTQVSHGLCPECAEELYGFEGKSN